MYLLHIFLLLSAILLYRSVRHLVNPLAYISGWIEFPTESGSEITLKDVHPCQFAISFTTSNYHILPTLDRNLRWLGQQQLKDLKKPWRDSFTPIIRFSTRLCRVWIELYFSQHPKVDITEAVLSYSCPIWLFSMQLRTFNFILDPTPRGNKYSDTYIHDLYSSNALKNIWRTEFYVSFKKFMTEDSFDFL